MFVIITKIDVDWGDAFFGYVPSKRVFEAGGLYTCEHPVFVLEMGGAEHSLFQRSV